MVVYLVTSLNSSSSTFFLENTSLSIKYFLELYPEICAIKDVSILNFWKKEKTEFPNVTCTVISILIQPLFAI